MKKLLLSLLAGAAAMSTATAQDSTSSPLTISGSVDTYYRTVLNGSNKGTASMPNSPGTSFANGTGFNVGMINIIASKEGKKSGFVADMVFGQRGADAVFNSQIDVDGDGNVDVNDALSIVNQAYIYYNISDKLTFSLGNFNTFLGYEVISPTANYNYSTSYMFSYGPFSHTGAKLNYAITDNLSAMVSLMNPTDYKTPNGQNNMFVGGQLGYTNDALGVYVNYLGGNGGTDGSDTTGYHQIDLTAGLQATDDLYIGLNTTYATQKISPNAPDKSITESGFAGIALYAQYALSESFSLGFRGESFMDRNGFTGAVPQYTINKNEVLEANTKGSATTLTLSAHYNVGDLTFIPEIRTNIYSNLTTDKKNPDAMPTWDASNIQDGSKLRKGISSFTLAAVYAF